MVSSRNDAGWEARNGEELALGPFEDSAQLALESENIVTAQILGSVSDGARGARLSLRNVTPRFPSGGTMVRHRRWCGRLGGRPMGSYFPDLTMAGR